MAYRDNSYGNGRGGYGNRGNYNSGGRGGNQGTFEQRPGTAFLFENQNGGRNAPAYSGRVMAEVNGEVVDLHVTLWEKRGRNGMILSGQVITEEEFQEQREKYKRDNGGGRDTDFNYGANRQRGRNEDDEEEDDREQEDDTEEEDDTPVSKSRSTGGSKRTAPAKPKKAGAAKAAASRRGKK